MLKKPLAIAAITTALAGAMLPTAASANGDSGLGALIGGAIGAAIGHDINGRHGALVGGVLGAMTGASIAAGSRDHYYGPDYAAPPVAYYPPAPVYYGPPRVTYRPAPVYYAPPPVIVRPRPVIVRDIHPRPPVYAPVVVVRRHDAPRHRHDHRFDYDRRWR